MEQNSIQLYDKITDPMAAVAKMGEMLARSGMFGCSKVEQGMVLALTCMSEKISPLDFMRRYHLIEGRPSQRADSMLADFRVRCHGTHRIVERTAEAAEVELSQGGNTMRFRLTWDDCKNEPFTKSRDGQVKPNWATPRIRTQMLWARVVSDGVRAMAPEICSGIYTPEEVEDFTEQSGAQKIQLKGQDKPAQVIEITGRPEPSAAAKSLMEEPATPATKTEPTLEQKIVALCGERMEEAYHYLVAKKYLKEGETLGGLEEAFARRMLGAPDKFFAAVDRWLKEVAA